MEELTNLVNQVAQEKFEMLNLKLEIEEMEAKAYIEWKKENPNDRTAKDKVVDVLRSQDPLWERKSQAYGRTKSLYEMYKVIYNVVLELLKNPQYTKVEIENLIKDTAHNWTSL